MRILFLCTGNRARSQLAEGLARHLAAPHVEIASAGTRPNPKGVHPEVVAVLAERGIDATRQRPKSIAELQGEFDYVITLCDEAAAECPAYPARRERLHWSLVDPDRAADAESQRELLREQRDELERRLAGLLAATGALRRKDG